MLNRLQNIECCDISMTSDGNILYTYLITELLCYHKLFFKDPCLKTLKEFLMEGEKTLLYEPSKNSISPPMRHYFMSGITLDEIIQIANNRVSLNDTITKLKSELPKGSLWFHKDYTCNPSSNALTNPIIFVEDEPYVIFDNELLTNVVAMTFSVCEVSIDDDNHCYLEKWKLHGPNLKKFLRDFADGKYERCKTPLDLVCRFENNFITLYSEHEGENVGWSLTYTKDYDRASDASDIVDFLDSCKDEQDALNKLSDAVDEFLKANDIDLCLKELNP